MKGAAMTIHDKNDLAQRLLTHADHYERLGKEHPSWRYPQMVMDMRAAARELVSPTQKQAFGQ
jgi:hypothetical protein